MSLNAFPQRIELMVWTTSTHLLKHSALVAQGVILTHDFYQWLTTRQANYKILFLALAGFCIGFVGGLIYLGIY